MCIFNNNPKGPWGTEGPLLGDQLEPQGPTDVPEDSPSRAPPVVSQEDSPIIKPPKKSQVAPLPSALGTFGLRLGGPKVGVPELKRNPFKIGL